jgi:hypothetical protein
MIMMTLFQWYYLSLSPPLSPPSLPDRCTVSHLFLFLFSLFPPPPPPSLYSVRWHLKLCFIHVSIFRRFCFHFLSVQVHYWKPFTTKLFTIMWSHSVCLYSGVFCCVDLFIVWWFKGSEHLYLRLKPFKKDPSLDMNLQHQCRKKCKFPMSYISSIVCFFISLVVVCI